MREREKGVRVITIEGANIHSLPVINEGKIDGDLRPQIRKWMDALYGNGNGYNVDGGRQREEKKETWSTMVTMMALRSS